MSSTNGPVHRSVSNIRPQATEPATPHTPASRPIPTNFGSPSALRAEEECIVIELGSRYLRVGFAGDAVPKAEVDFGPEQQRRPGDYRRYHQHYNQAWRQRSKGKDWGEEHELWRLDLRDQDLGLIGDKIERGLREALVRNLLVDSRPRRMFLVLPSVLPLPLVSTILDSLFNNFQSPSVSLMSAPVLSTVAAGLRSALVVDIGWAETIVTAIYELREIQTQRSIRATKSLGEEMFKVLANAIDSEQKSASNGISIDVARKTISFEECEDIVTRMVWCKQLEKSEPAHAVSSDWEPSGLAPVKEEDELRSSMRSLRVEDEDEEESDPMMSIPLTSTSPPKTLDLPFSRFAEPCEKAFFANGTSLSDLDDEELPLHLLVYRSLLRLPIDVRTMCMARIVFVGGGSHIIGLKERVLDEVQALVSQEKWDPVHGKAVKDFENNPKLRHLRRRQANGGPTEVDTEEELYFNPKSNPAFSSGDFDLIEETLRRENNKGVKPIESGYLRAVESLGAWSGGSLLSQLRVPAVSIIDRDQWLLHGAAGASREIDANANLKRQSMGAAAFKAGGGDRSSWTLGLWG